ncbi:MAG: hydrogenase [Candidatus Delongbacteria bacterium]
MSANRTRVELMNGLALPLDQVPQVEFPAFRDQLLESVAAGQRVSALFARRPQPGPEVELLLVLADDARSRLHVSRCPIRSAGYPSLTPDCPQLHLFEREIAEETGLRPEGHPWLKPVRYLAAREGDPELPPGTGDFYRVEGDEVHEVAVGPVHAGVIEPGHFRFQVLGEEVLHLEIALGYQHRGVERALAGHSARGLHLAETLAGDSSVAHATAWCQALEALADCPAPLRAQALRGVGLELERLANHVGDLGALAGDVGFLPTSSWCGRLRGDFLNLSALLCGNRFGRGLVRPGGLGFDVDPARISLILERLEGFERDTRAAITLLWDTPSAMARFEDTGVLAQETARELGLVGPAARASGLARDVRLDHPAGIWRFSHIPLASAGAGDVFARAQVRWTEIQRSLEFIRDQLRSLAGGPIRAAAADGADRLTSGLAPDMLAVSLVEGWRGEVCHTLLTDGAGRIARCKVVDPSFHNWSGLALALRGQQISDFPLCNKSFNLSYCGHDL